MKTFRPTPVATLVTSILLLAACSSSSPETGPLTLSVTDMPIDSTEIDSVCVDFTEITVHYASAQDVVLTYDPLASQVTSQTHCTDTIWDGQAPVPAVRLDALGGPLTVALVESLQIPVGRITWIRLHFTGNSFVLDNLGGQYPLRCPSCDITDNNDGRGFKLNRTFEVSSGGLAVTVDVDLLKSLHRDAEGYVLRPTARIELDNTLGTIAGEVEEAVITGRGGTLYSGGDLDTGCAVYVYAGHNAVPDDHYDGSPVISTARVRYNESLGLYGYAAGALPGGTSLASEPYTVALTCDADDPTADEALSFTVGQNADVVTGQTAAIDFGIAP